MRLRKVKNALEKLKAYENVVFFDGLEEKGRWNEKFPTQQELRIEIGCGKGQFIINMAKAFPEVNFLAIEKFDSVLIRALELYEQEPLPNVRFLLADAKNVKDIFATGEVSKIYLNFSDPWPKTKHAKRRLTASSFLDDYKDILVKNGEIIQKTDNRLLFESSLVSYSINNFLLKEISLNLHDTEIFNITTEFEDKWSKLGPIYYAVVAKKDE